MSDEIVDQLAQFISKEILRTSWAGLASDGRIGDKGFPTFCWYNYGLHRFQGRQEDVRDLARQILARATPAIKAEALREAADIAKMFSINETPIHPDISWHKMSEQAQTVAHTTCQCVSWAISDRATEYERNSRNDQARRNRAGHTSRDMAR